MAPRKTIQTLIIIAGTVLTLSFGFGAFLLFRAHRPSLSVQQESGASATSQLDELLRQGAEHLRSHRTEQAIVAYRQALAHSPRSLEAQLGIAQGELLAGREDAAIGEYQRALRLDAGNLLALRQLAGLYSHQFTAWKQSEEMFRQYLSLKPDDAEGQLGLARVLAWQGKSQEAVSWFSREPVLTLMTSQDRRDFAFALVKSGQADRAEPLLNQLLRERPRDFDLRLQLASLYASRKAWDRALPLYRDLLKERPRDTRLLMTYGLGLLAVKDYEAASRPLETACRTASRPPEACLGYARALKGMGKLKPAAREFDQVMPHYERDASITREFADLLLEKRDYRGSEKTYKQAYELGLRDDALLIGLAGALRGNGKSREALPYLEEAYRRRPTDRLAFELAKLYQKLGRNDRALELLEQIESSAQTKRSKNRG
ncbi:MAG: tetratricopeptide repeat protein [Acidobacteriota bacterium]